MRGVAALYERLANLNLIHVISSELMHQGLTLRTIGKTEVLGMQSELKEELRCPRWARMDIIRREWKACAKKFSDIMVPMYEKELRKKNLPAVVEESVLSFISECSKSYQTLSITGRKNFQMLNFSMGNQQQLRDTELLAAKGFPSSRRLCV